MLHSGGQRDAAVLSTSLPPSLPALSFWCLHWPPLKAPAFFCLSGRRYLLLLPLRSPPLCPSSLRDISKRVSPDHSCLFDALITRLPPSALRHARARSALREAHMLPLMEEWSHARRGVIGATWTCREDAHKASAHHSSRLDSIPLHPAPAWPSIFLIISDTSRIRSIAGCWLPFLPRHSSVYIYISLFDFSTILCLLGGSERLE